MNTISFDELTNKYDSHIHIFMVSGDKEKDRLSIKNMLDTKIQAQYIIPLMIVPNKDDGYHDYLKQLAEEFGLLDYEIYYIEEIQTLYPELKNLSIFSNWDYIYSKPNYFLTILSLSIARTEAIGSENLWVPWTYYDLQNITTDVYEYINAIKELATIGTLEEHVINIKFPILQTDKRLNIHQPKTINTKDDSALIMFSGGLDCTVAAYIMDKLGKNISLYNVQYGQSNRYQEQYSIKKIVADLNREKRVPFEQISLSCIPSIGGSALLSDDTTLQSNNSKLEYVPFRNTNLLNFGLIYAIKQNIKYVVTGGHHDDTLSPDNRLPYFETFQRVLNLQNCSKEIKLYPVLLYLGGKSELIYVGNHLNVNFKNCWSCLNYIGHSEVGENCRACGTCGNCSTRYHAFRRVGLHDPVEYLTIPHMREEWYGWADGSDKLLEQLGITNLTYYKE
ncbi:hypothetical protein EAI05_14035 [Bacillus subtilis]|uniref:7-cyano-7-deazaguanine synthase n=1 Tax=Bacillus subtilis TaxID=1423 RepID=UPI000F082875|nr:7-cyano-7-deazaguanine synthase [Bacillus subtilis]QQF64476.1 7-cyano-7-deazaguanine synthase [Bacillus mojavensis]MBO3637056.1 7-cyano-7-deazaguanine synthase [Bacillus subtilis]MCV2517489.1 7-cyano-7-deazaguanine synthase [Bacillus subtilis]QHJ99342.1 7-cyano-7-deazaguanine synthase [Bacillus subtilis]RNA71744.1 hypothetical protein EAI05_14035 [Bacillus subtilis]